MVSHRTLSLAGRLHTLARRLRWQHVLRAACWGVLLGTALAIVILVAGYALAVRVQLLATLVFASVLVAWIVGGLSREPDLRALARTVDERAGLKDRTLSALAFARKQRRTACEELELADAVAALEKLVASEVLPLRLPRIAPLSAVAVLVLAITLSISLRERPVAAQPPAALPEVLQAAEQVRSELATLRREARELKEPELEDLVEELEKLVQRMERPGVDVREALATLSELQHNLARQRAKYMQALAEPVLTELADVFADSGTFQATAAALKKKDYAKAARELQKQRNAPPPQEASRLAKRLSKVAKAAARQGASDLEGAITELTDALQSTAKDRDAKFAKACRGLGRCLGRRAKLGRLCSKLSAACRAVGLCKGQCAGRRSGGPKRPAAKSERPSSSWGRGVAGNLNGEPTRLDAAKKLELLTGMQGEGPSERELSSTPEGQQQASRAYREQFEQYLRMSQEVLESEPIPLGQRELIRRYFELIRPRAPEASEPARP